jgi:hypothetical protein
VSARWSGGAAHRGLLALAVAVAALPPAGLLRFGATGGSLFVVLLVGALTLACGLALAWVRVAVRDGAVRVGAGPWGWPARRLRREAILAARAVAVADPVTLGTLGYEEPSGHSAVVVRPGECLALDLAGGRSLTVSVDGAEAAAAAVNAGLAVSVP